MSLLETLRQPQAIGWTVGIVSGILAILIATVLWLTVSVRRLKKRQDTLFQDGEAASAEGVLQRHSEEIGEMDKEIQQLFEISNQLHALGQRSIHRVGFVRFNPFKDVGGNQSFSLALLDGKNNGVVVSSLHTREGSRVYAKPVSGSQSPVPLTEEEKKALAIAQARPTRPEN